MNKIFKQAKIRGNGNYRSKVFLISLVLLSLALIFSFSIDNVSAAPGDTIYVNGSSGNNFWDGQSAIYNSTTGSGPKATITNATGTVANNGIIHIADGTYNEYGITLNNNMTIMGQSQTSTIINGQGSGNIFTIPAGVTVAISNLSIVNGHSTTSSNAGAINNQGTITLTNTTFSSNMAGDGWYGGLGSCGGPGGSGGAIYNTGNLTLINAIFSFNRAGDGGEGDIGGPGGSGGAIYNTGNLTITNANFSSNRAGDGAKSFFRPGVNGGDGGAIYNSGNLTLTNANFSSNRAGNGGGTNIGNVGSGGSGGAIYNSGNLTVTDNTFLSNLCGKAGDGYLNDYISGGSGGAVYSSGNLTIINSIFSSNRAGDGGFSACGMGGSGGSGGAVHSSGNLTITYSTFSFNQAGNAGYTAYNWFGHGGNGGAVSNIGYGTINFNRIVNNTVSTGYGSAVYNGYNLNADDNWWGYNTGPASGNLYGLTVNSWLKINITANPVILPNGSSSSTVTINLQSYNSTTGNYSSITDCAPIPISFNTTQGSITPNSATIINGLATSVFTPSTTGTLIITAIIDNQQLSTSVKLLLNDVYVSPTGNDTNNGTSWADAKATIGYAIGTVADKGTVHIADGTYYENNMDINTSMTMIGQSQDGTMINGQRLGSIFIINPGITITLINMTIENGTAPNGKPVGSSGGAIYNSGNLTVINVTFTGNNAGNGISGTDGGDGGSGGSGGAIYNNGNLTLTNSIFAGNNAGNGAPGDSDYSNLKFGGSGGNGGAGGAIYNNGNLTVTNTTFANNNAGNGAYGGGWCGYGGYGGSGGAIYNNGNLTLTNSTLSSNSAGNGGQGGVGFFMMYGGDGGPGGYGGAIFNNKNLIVTSATIINNKAGKGGPGGTYGDYSGNSGPDGSGGAIHNNVWATLNFNRIVGNNASNGNVICNYGSSMNATNNWWGSNNPDFSRLIYGNVDVDTWIVLRINNTPNLIGTSETSAVNVNLNYNSNDEDTLAVYGISVPDVNVLFDTDGLGSLNPTTGIISSGLGTTSFTAGSIPGFATVNATVDNQTINTSIRIMDRNDLYVATAADGGNDSTGNGSKDYPFLTLSKAVTELRAGGRIHIANGIYNGALNKELTINKNMTITGQSQNGTIIDAERSGNIFFIDNGISLILQNLTLTNGNTNYGGGAVYNSGNLTAENCTFSDNTENQDGGGAIHNRCFNGNSVTSTMINCTFSGNHANYYGGGAIYNDCSVDTVRDIPGSIISTVINCTFVNNAAYWGSGVIYNDCSGLSGFSSINSTVTGCTFINNTATYSGGGAITNQCYTNGGSSSIISNITNCTFNNNRAAFSGGSINNYCAVQSGSASFTSIVDGCTFIGNKAQSGGDVNNDCSVYSGLGSFISTITDCNFTNNNATNSGGAIYNYHGTLTVENCTFSDNDAFYGGAVYNRGNLTVNDCTFSGNTAQYGGAIYNYGNLTVGNCTFARNTARSDGGAIYNERSISIGNLTLGNCNFSNNNATYSGGAVYNKGSLTMENCNFNDNASKSSYGGGGGAICNYCTAGGIPVVNTVTHCSFNGNSARGGGGAVYNYISSASDSIINTVVDCTFTNNNASYGGAIGNFVNSASGSINITVTGCTFLNNTANGGGAICNMGGNCNINFNRIFGNTATPGRAILNYRGSVNAENNWWGSNNPDFSKLLFGTVDADPWVVLRLNETPDLIGTGETSTLSVNLNYNSNGEDLLAVYGKSVPDVNVVFDAGTLGSLDPLSVVISSGLDTSTLFTAGSIPAVAAVNATVDGQILSAVRIMDRDNLYVATAADGGSDSTGNGSPDHPFLTLNKAFTELRTGGKIHIANGVYNGSLNKALIINKNMSVFPDLWISGTGNGVIIDAEHSSNIFIINSGKTVLIQNLTLMNGISGFGGAIHNEGNLTVENCNFTSNRAGVVGGAIVNWYGTLNVTNCTFTGNIAIGDGGAIGSSGICTVTNSIFINNTAGNGGAIFNYLDILNVTGCIFSGNTATQGGALSNADGTCTVHFSRFYNNTATNGNAMYCNSGSVDAENNWWSSNKDPKSIDNLFVEINGGLVDADPWVILSINANPTSINNTGISTIIADFNHNMDRSGNIGILTGHIPDGPVTMDVPWGSFTNPGITHSITLNTFEGVITATFYANEGAVNPLFNPVKITATADDYTTNDTESAYITVNKAANLYIHITSNIKNPKVGQKFTITYKLGNKGPDSADNVTITIPLPKGFEIVNIKGDGNWTYNSATRTITWTLENVPVGDPYLYITGKVLRPGNYVFSSSISSKTYNINSEGVTPITIHAVKAASKTIPMQKTGLPLNYLILAILMVIGGLLVPKRK